METFAIWKEGMAFDGRAQGFNVPMDASPPLGHQYGPGPKELVALGLAGCAGMDVVGILKKKKQFIFKRDIRDMSHVWFYDETTQMYYKINLANGEIPAMSVSEYKEVRKIIGKKNAASIVDHEIIEAREELHRQVIEASKKSKKVRRELEKAKIHKARIEMPSAKQSPIDVQKIDKEDSIWDDDIPIFD